MSPMQPSVNNINDIHNTNNTQTISTFTSELPANYNAKYNSNFAYKGADPKNQRPSPIDMMASQSIGLQRNTAANEIIKPKILMEH